LDQLSYRYSYGQITKILPAEPASESDPAETWTLCEHLQPLAEAILKRGASICGISTAWSRTLLAVTMDRGPRIAAANRLVATMPQVTIWENNDSHYAIEYGVQCNDCRHSLSWPQAAAYDGE